MNIREDHNSLANPADAVLVPKRAYFCSLCAAIHTGVLSYGRDLKQAVNPGHIRTRVSDAHIALVRVFM